MEVNEPTRLILRSVTPSERSTSRSTEDCAPGWLQQLNISPYPRFPLIQKSVNAISSAFFTISRWGSVTGAFCLVFGGIHCVAWNFSFVSPQERLVWRICGVILTVSIPLSWMLTRLTLGIWHALFGDTPGDERGNPAIHWTRRNGQCKRMIPPLVQTFHGVGLALYVLARFYLLVEAFLSLRSLPVGCYDTIDWLKFWPHI